FPARRSSDLVKLHQPLARPVYFFLIYTLPWHSSLLNHKYGKSGEECVHLCVKSNMNCFRYLYIIVLITSFLLSYQGFSQKAKTRAAAPYGLISLFLCGCSAYYFSVILYNTGML